MTHNTREVEDIVDKLPYHKENTNGTVSNIRYYERAVVIKALHHQLQKAREEEREKVVDEVAFAFSKHRDYQLSELHRSNNRKEIQEYIAKGIEVFYLNFLRRLDILKAQNQSELDQDKT